MNEQRPEPSGVRLLGPARIRDLATELGIRPSKGLGQNFVVDANTVRRIARLSGVGPEDTVLEVGPGLGSLTLALLETGARVVAVEIDARLAGALPGTVAEHASAAVAERLRVLHADALDVTAADLVLHTASWVGDAVRMPDATATAGPPPLALVANLPYNVAVPVLLSLLERLERLQHGLVMVQAEVAERLAAGPGERAYGVPSVKAAWYAEVSRAGVVPRQVFWPVPGVDSGLVAFRRRRPPAPDAARPAVFGCVDAAFAQRRKTLRAALAGWAGSAVEAERIVRAAGLDPSWRGERLSVQDFAALAAAGTTAAGTDAAGSR